VTCLHRYVSYMQSDAWRARRARTLMLAGSACQRCGARVTAAHHQTYDRLGHERDADLEALCPGCHAAAHG
jgi:5-methylcytosine-specific restriction endonuclease McrA